MPDGSRKLDIPMQTRLAPVQRVNAETRTADLVFSRGAQVRRWQWTRDWDIEEYLEELSMDPAHVRMGRLRNGAPLLDTHERRSLESVIGVVEAAEVSGGEGRATVRFSERESVQPIFQDVKAGVIRNVSVGYFSYKYEEMGFDPQTGLRILRCVDWEPFEISLVPVGADADAGTRAEQQRTASCEFVFKPADPAITRKESNMDEVQRAAKEAADKAAADKQRSDEIEATRKAAAETERTRVSDIRARCDKHKLDRAFEDKLIAEGVSIEQAGVRILDELAKRQEAGGAIASTGFGEGARTTDERRTHIRTHMAEAIGHRLRPTEKLSDGAREFRYMSLLRMAEECLLGAGVNVRGMDRMQMATRALHSTSDFPNILADTLNKRLRQAYEENVPTYRRWARRAANAPDFKTITVAQLSGAPDLQLVLEGAEFKRGSVSDAKETYAILTYGRILSISRQALINDDLSALDRFPMAFSGSAARLENGLVYAQLTSNPTMADTGALFNNTAVTTAGGHANLMTSTTIDATNLGLARAAMRKQVGLQSEQLNLAPKFLLCGPDKEQLAYQFTSSQYVPATPATVNEFRAGGRTALDPIVESLLTGNQWYLAADYAQVDTVEYCYLDGNEGVYLEQQIGFTVDGIDLKARDDFATKVIDFRGLVKNAGA